MTSTLPPTYLPIRNIDPWWLYGEMFVHYPAAMPWTECINNLQAAIVKNGDNVIDPCTVLTAITAEEERIARNIPDYIHERNAMAAWEERRAKRIKQGLKAPAFPVRFVENGASPEDENALAWDEKNGCAVRANRQPQKDWNF